MEKSTKLKLSNKSHKRAIRKMDNKRKLSCEEKRIKAYHESCLKKQEQLGRKLTKLEKNKIWKEL